MNSTAVFSPDRIFRYVLTRQFGDKPGRIVNFICLNPSTADETVNDPTVTRCIGFAKKWGFGTLVVTNVFALRSTDPKRVTEVRDPIGPGNDRWVGQAARNADLVVCAWGTHAAYMRRQDQIVRRLPGDLWCLGKTVQGFPRHPLYLKADTEVVPWP